MKNLFIILAFLLAIIFLSCSDDVSGPGGSGVPVISLTSPNGGEVMQIGAPYTITWSDNILENVDFSEE